MEAKPLTPPEPTKTPFAYERKMEAAFAVFGLIFIGTMIGLMGLYMHFLVITPY